MLTNFKETVFALDSDYILLYIVPVYVSHLLICSVYTHTPLYIVCLFLHKSYNSWFSSYVLVHEQHVSWVVNTIFQIRISDSRLIILAAINCYTSNVSKILSKSSLKLVAINCHTAGSITDNISTFDAHTWVVRL